MSVQTLEYREQQQPAKPEVKTCVVMEIPGKHTLADLASLLGDNQEFVTNVRHGYGDMW